MALPGHIQNQILVDKIWEEHLERNVAALRDPSVPIKRPSSLQRQALASVPSFVPRLMAIDEIIKTIEQRRQNPYYRSAGLPTSTPQAIIPAEPTPPNPPTSSPLHAGSGAVASIGTAAVAHVPGRSVRRVGRESPDWPYPRRKPTGLYSPD